MDQTLDHLSMQLECFFDSRSCFVPSPFVANLGGGFERPARILALPRCLAADFLYAKSAGLLTIQNNTAS